MKWTYGMELEFADYDRRRKLPKGFVNNRKDFTVVNSNGIANDPTDRVYKYGGEINTPATGSIECQVGAFEELLATIPEAKVNYRSNLHCHIRIPGLRDDLKALKRIQKYIHTHMPMLFFRIQPIIPLTRWNFASNRIFEGAVKRYKRMLVSHHTLLSDKRLTGQLAARSIDEFFKAEVPHRRDGSPCWHLQPRVCVSLRQLLETDTIEFRHGFGTLSPELTYYQLAYCRLFLEHALENADVHSLFHAIRRFKFPTCGIYNHDMECKYRATCHDGSNTIEQIKTNIELIQSGRWKNG